MCDPSLIFAAARTALTVYQSQQSAKADREQAIAQNQIAENARIQKENSENLRIRQVAVGKKDKAFDVSLASLEAQATARTAAENVGGKALDRVVNNYLRIEGKTNSQIIANLEAEIAQSNQNKKLFAHEQEARQVLIPEVNTAGIFASGAIEFGGDYLEWKRRKEEKELLQERMDSNIT